LILFHPSYLGLSPYAAVRCRHYRKLLQPSEDPRDDRRDPRWTTSRAIGSPAFLKRHGLSAKLRRARGAADSSTQLSRGCITVPPATAPVPGT
jgi:hypothetical protein